MEIVQEANYRLFRRADMRRFAIFAIRSRNDVYYEEDPAILHLEIFKRMVFSNNSFVPRVFNIRWEIFIVYTRSISRIYILKGNRIYIYIYRKGYIFESLGNLLLWIHWDFVSFLMMISDDIFAQIKNKFPFLGNSSDYAIQFILELKLSRIDAITHTPGSALFTATTF